MSEENKAPRGPRRGMGGGHGGGPGGALGRPVEKAKNFKGTMKRLLAYLKPQRTSLTIVIAFAIISTTFTVLGPRITGDAMNQLTDGFVAKSVVDGLSKAQPGMQDALKAYNDAIDNATKQAGSAVEQAINAQKQTAYDQAKAQAEAGVKAQINKQFMAAAPGMPESQLSKIPGYNEALSKALAAVDEQVTSTVDQKFAEQITSAKQTAEQKAKDAVDQAFMDKQKLTKDQLDTFLSLGKLPNIKDTSDYNQRADIANQFFTGMKKLPTDMVSSNNSIQSSNLNLSNITDENLTKFVKNIRETGGNIPFDAVGTTLLKLLLIYLLSSVFAFVMQYVMSSVAQKVVYNMRKDVDNKLARLPLKYYDAHSNGEILSRVTNDIDTVSSTLQQSLTQLIQSVLQLIGYLIMMLTISPLLTLFVMLTLPLYIFVTTFIAKKSQKYFAAQQKHLGELSGHTEEMFTGHKIVKAFGHEQESIETFEAVNDELYKAGWKAQFLSGVMFPLMNFISNLGYVLISVVGGIFVTKTWLNIGDITAFIQYSRQFSMPIIQTANIANIIQSTVACAERVFEVLDEEEEIPDAEHAKELVNPRGDIVFDHVKFSYKDDQSLIEDMNLDIKKGETVAIVGPTGAGKTTLVNLLMRFYEIKGGKITFDGVDVRDIKRGNLRTMFGMVLQDTWLFNGTIEDNIRYGRGNATHDEIVAAAKAAHADHFIRSLPEGYNTILNEEASNISQGQKQLLTIARAILADPAVLILDEATSSVDTRTEVRIQKAMGHLMEGRTNFVIAHRLSTIRDAKLILVMNHGSIIESGNHQELLAAKGFYADLYNSQFTGPAMEPADQPAV